MIKLYRIDWEYDEYIGGDEYEAHTHYEYLIGDRKLGKAIAWGYKDGDRCLNVWRLEFSLRALRVCFQHLYTSIPNRTAKTGSDRKT